MSDDPLDDASARLFEAVRSEPIPHGAELRVLARARREQRARASRRVTALLALAAAVALMAAFFVRRREPASAISAEPNLPSARRVSNHAPAEPPLEPPASAPRNEPSAVSPRPKLAPSAANAPSAPVLSLDDELSRLKAAETALNAGDARRALEILNEYDAAKGQRMRAEAALLRIEALARSGDSTAASALAESFAVDNPGSPLVDRARSYIMKEEHDE